MVRIKIVENYGELSHAAAGAVISLIKKKPNAVFALPTGSTPLGAYKYLADACAAGIADFSKARIFALDEYLGLGQDGKQSFAFFLNESLLSKINVGKESIFPLDGLAKNPEDECKSYEAKIKACGGIDLALLGIGNNGHVAFNEPGTGFSSLTHVVELAESTRSANSRFFARLGDVPKQALTIGLKTVMGSKSVLLLASGAAKADAVAKALEGQITEAVPASILQKHRNAIAILDKDAAAKL